MFTQVNYLHSQRIKFVSWLEPSVTGKSEQSVNNPVILIGWFLVFVFSVTVYEAAHAWMAKRGGGVTLNV